ncbi:MAG TPA: histidine kinase [Xanthobacteraceae bacterium]|nr:histidine kinase [Xanthobacteraceae bacterium]
MAYAVAARAEPADAATYGALRSRVAGLLDACWYRQSVRAQLLLTVILIDLVAALVAGGVVIMKARTSTQIEIDASMNLAEVLVRETIKLMPADTPPERFLEALPLQQRFARHVRIAVRDTAGHVVATRPMQVAEEVDFHARAPAPAWFAALVSPPIEHRELPVVVQGRALGSVLIAGEPGDEIAEVWENLTALATVAALVNLAMNAILYVLFGRVLGPLRALGAGLLDLERRSFGVRLARPRARELAAIADRFNALAGALESARAENATLYRRLITTQDDERRNTARELHDEVGPSLFGLKANAGSIASVAAALPDAPRAAVQERAGDILAIVEHLQSINRSLLTRLRPMALGHVPLADLLAEMIHHRARELPQIAFPFAAAGIASSYGEEIDLTVYRCAQEGLTNAIKHAQARRIGVTLAETVPDPALTGARGAKAQLELAIEDDGCGIVVPAPAGFGLRGMQERVHALGGACSLGRAAGGGTCVRVVIPLPDRGDVNGSEAG